MFEEEPGSTQQISENGSEGHTLSHPTLVRTAEDGSLLALEASTHVEGVMEDDPPVICQPNIGTDRNSIARLLWGVNEEEDSGKQDAEEPVDGFWNTSTSSPDEEMEGANEDYTLRPIRMEWEGEIRPWGVDDEAGHQALLQILREENQANPYLPTDDWTIAWGLPGEQDPRIVAVEESLGQ
jgi:hypothetical protein